ncbi:MAG TPA: patatin-like phospholipase family protein [Ilumatobacteraceae bacterium]
MASSHEAPERPLESPALGSSLDSLITPCHDALRPASPPAASGTPIGATFSGGGFRATFAALGVVRYLADAGVLGDLRYSSSVSGGSVANGMLATRWPQLRDRQFSPEAVDELVIAPLAKHVVAASLKTKLIRNVWRATLRKNRTDVLAWAFDDWLFDKADLESLDAQCRWIFNASNLVTGTRFGFERDVVGDYVVGLAPTKGSGLRVAQAVAASAAVPGAFAAMKVDQVTFPCAGRGVPELLDGGAYDNSGLEAIDSNRYHDVFTVSMNAGGVFVTGAYGKVPLVRDLARANSLLYRQSTTLRTRAMVGRFLAWQATPPGAVPGPDARRGVLFGLATEIGDTDRSNPAFAEFVERFPEHRTFADDGVERDLAFVPTVFDQLSADLVAALVYRGWWLTGAALALHQPDFAPLPAGTVAPPHHS